MANKFLLLLPLVTLASCSGDSLAKFEALTYCSEQLTKEFPAAEQSNGNEVGEGVLDGFVFRADGSFDLTVPDPNGATLWACSGNTKTRIINRLKYKGVQKLPRPDQIWSY